MEVVAYNNYAGFFIRFIAFFIDSIVIRFFLAVLFGYFSDIEMYDIKNLFGRGSIAIELFMMAYFVLCETSVWQGTVGKRLLGMKVVNSSFGRLSTKEAVIRYLSKYLSACVLLLGFIWIIFDRRKQGWHDELAHTFVINSK